MFKVTSIQFDFDEADEMPSQEYMDYLMNETLNNTWEADSEETLFEEIEAFTGYCIVDIEYDVLP